MLGACLDFLEAIGLAFEGDDLSVVGEPVDEGNDAGGVRKYLATLGEWAVGGDGGALSLVAAIGQLEPSPPFSLPSIFKFSATDPVFRGQVTLVRRP